MEPKALAQIDCSPEIEAVAKTNPEHFISSTLRGYTSNFLTDPLQINRWIEGETPAEWEDICQATLEMLDEGKLFYEDATPFLLLKELIQGFQTNRSIKHIRC